MLKLQDLVSSYTKHIFIELSSDVGLPGEKDLEVLKNLPVSAIVLDLGKTNPADATKLKDAIGKMEPRKRSNKAERSVLVPLTGPASIDEVESGDEGYEEDEDWDV